MICNTVEFKDVERKQRKQELNAVNIVAQRLKKMKENAQIAALINN